MQILESKYNHKRKHKIRQYTLYVITSVITNADNTDTMCS